MNVMSLRGLFFLLGAIVVVFVMVPLIPNPLEQTVFLERVAQRIERAPVIAPQTENAIRQTIQSVRRNGEPADEQLAARQKAAIQRIEDILWNRGGMPPEQAVGAPTFADATFPPRLSLGDEVHTGQFKPLRPLYPFQPNELHDRLQTNLEGRP